jgi:signal transduction histidine kinase
MTTSPRMADATIAQRVLVLAPTGRDAAVTREVLARGAIVGDICDTVDELCAKLAEGAGALVLAEEVLNPGVVGALGKALAAQPPWSDIPILVSTAAGEITDARMRAVRALEPSGNVTILERPARVFSLLVSIHAMLRARGRQYQMRDLHLELQRQMERLEVEHDLRARFVSLLAHDLRGPLSGAMLAAQNITRAPDKVDDRRGLAARLKRNLDRIEEMVRNLLDASRIQSGQPLLLNRAECDLGAIASEVVDELNSQHGHRIHLNAEHDVRGYWSAAELRRAAWNLASNAIKYGASGAPVVVTVNRLADRARLAVHNRGAPISPEEQQRIFEPFARARSSEESRALGWGLGLTLVRGCAEAHGGTVELRSSEEHGTTFVIDVPLDARGTNTPNEQAAS